MRPPPKPRWCWWNLTKHGSQESSWKFYTTLQGFLIDQEKMSMRLHTEISLFATLFGPEHERSAGIRFANFSSARKQVLNRMGSSDIEEHKTSNTTGKPVLVRRLASKKKQNFFKKNYKKAHFDQLQAKKTTKKKTKKKKPYFDQLWEKNNILFLHMKVKM